MKAYRFRIPLTSPLNLKGIVYSHREGVLLERDGRWAEASPLPGFNAETIEDVIDALRGKQDPPPSLRFALSSLESAVVSTLGVPWNFLLLGDHSRILSGVEQCLVHQCRAVKLKVGRSDLHSEIELVRTIRDRLPSNVCLRLDANKAWSMDEATSFVNSISDLYVEYIEEPLQDSSLLEELYAETGVQYALDETLLHVDSFEKWPNASAMICKPTIIGGRDAVRRLADSGKPVVFSAAFESGVGISRIVQLAAEFSPTLAAGLDTLDWLSSDLLFESPQKKEGMFYVGGEPKVDINQLERIEI